jgi:hypothetical protein
MFMCRRGRDGMVVVFATTCTISAYRNDNSGRDCAMVMVLNATFNNISVISMEKIVVPGENHRPVASH